MTTTTFLTFVGDQWGKATEAMNFYTSIFPNSEIKSITKYADGEAGGTPELIKFGVFILNGTTYMVSELYECLLDHSFNSFINSSTLEILGLILFFTLLLLT